MRQPPRFGYSPARVTPRPSRRDVLKLGMLAAAGLGGLTSLSACAAVPQKPDPGTPQVRGGVYSHGATGGGLKDTLDPYFPVTNPDIARCLQLYEPLLRWNAEYEIEPAVAESVTPNADNTQWTIRLRDGVEFHNGKTVTAEDVMFSLARVTDPKNTGSGGTELATILELNNSKIVDPTTILLQLNSPYAVLDQLLAEYTVGIIPTDFDVANPVGTGPFALPAFVPGQLSRIVRHDNYWDGPAWVDELFIYDFADDAAKVNALLAGQVQSVDNLPTYLAGTIEQQGASPLVSETGAWVPFTMRVDVGAVLRRPGAAGAAAGGGPAADDRPGAERLRRARQRHVLPVRPGLRQGPAAARAGHRPGQVAAGRRPASPTWTSSWSPRPRSGRARWSRPTCSSSRPRPAGITVRLTKADSNTFYGDRYLSWNFAQDFWNTRNYIPQVAACAVKTATYNETHFDDPTFNALIDQAKREPDPARRTTLLHDAQEIEYNTGGYIIWGFKRQLDAYSNLVQGLAPHRYLPCSCFGFKHASFVPQT